VAGVVAILLVGSSRVAIGYHYPLDVLAGWFAGVAWLAALYAAGVWLTNLRRRK
jgi:undecaprenyl-diphosphatase